MHEWRVEAGALREEGYMTGSGDDPPLEAIPLDRPWSPGNLIARLAYLVFLPLSLGHYRRKQAADPGAFFFPVDDRKTDRCILTSGKLLFVRRSWDSYEKKIIPLRLIEEVEQEGRILRIHVRTGTLTILREPVGRRIGELLVAMHVLTPVRVRHADESWRRLY